jgi:hypothetical protein
MVFTGINSQRMATAMNNQECSPIASESPLLTIRNWTAWIKTVDGLHNFSFVSWLAVNAKEPAALI